ncbi:hypothetical protein TNCV_4976531 [Trichonephila clavipes]|nr:hypothetical protein TNCV_4976531 [Trichonephila clavipes]
MRAPSNSKLGLVVRKQEESIRTGPESVVANGVPLARERKTKLTLPRGDNCNVNCQVHPSDTQSMLNNGPHNGNEVDDWIGLDEWNSWFKSQVRDSNRSQDIVNLNKLKKFKAIKNWMKKLYEHEIIITQRADREGSNEPGPNGL